MAKHAKIRKGLVFLGIIIIIMLVAISLGTYILINNPDIFKHNDLAYVQKEENSIVEEKKEDTAESENKDNADCRNWR